MFQRNRTEINRVIGAWLLKSKSQGNIIHVESCRTVDIKEKLDSRSELHRAPSKVRTW